MTSCLGGVVSHCQGHVKGVPGGCELFSGSKVGPKTFDSNTDRVTAREHAIRYLLNQEDQPECVGCACPLTVQHIMIDCVEFAYIRSRFFDVRNMNDLFDSVTPSTILLYVKGIGLFSRCDLTPYLGLCTHLTITFFSSGLWQSVI